MLDIILKFPREYVDYYLNKEIVYEYVDITCIREYSGGSLVAMKECDWWLDYYNVPDDMLLEVIEELKEYGIPSRVEVKINQQP